MLAPRQVIFTSMEGTLLDSASSSWEGAEEALQEIERRGTPLILVSRRTRAQIEPLRRKMGHTLPFITERGGGLFIPDDYFPMHLEGAVRTGRYFCVALGRPYPEVVEALEEIAAKAGAEAIGYAQLAAREIARNTGQSVRDAELDRQREFSERFFLAGGGDEEASRLTAIARERGWEVIAGEPFWEICSGNDVGRAVRHLMRLFRTATRSRLRSVGIGTTAKDYPLLAAVDHAVVLPYRRREFDPELTGRLPSATPGEASGRAGWNAAVLQVLDAAEVERR